MKEKKEGLSRRQFLSYSALGLAGLTILPNWTMGGVRIAPSDRVVMGFIGLGRQSLGDFNGFASCPGVQVAACCDVDNMKMARFRKKVNAWQKAKEMTERCDAYEFYENLLSRKDIDAISIVSPDHWHALMTIDACNAGKDVYCQKPLAYTITEGLEMVKAVRNNNRVLQVGSQQRSSKEFQKAIALVQNGDIGYIPQGYRGTKYATMKYANGIEMTEQPYLNDNEGAQGIKFIGTDGWIEVARGHLACSDPTKVPEELGGKRPALFITFINKKHDAKQKKIY